MKIEKFITHLFIVLITMIALGIAVALIGLIWYGAFVVWSYIF